MSAVCPPHNDIDNMVQVKAILERISKENQQQEYTSILIKVNHYIETRCNHYIVTDTIDIDPDRSQAIHYCEICFKTFAENKQP
uniref:Uncharacterized protein n=1 Tax=viral metagenome TaxID=1070528 RepID=A0A6C0I2U8_9ZZZZ